LVDVKEVLDTLSKLMDANTILQLLDYDNLFEIRGRGCELLIKFLDIVSQTFEKEKDQKLTKAFAGCVNFLPFCGPFAEKTRTILETFSIRGQENFSYAKKNIPQTPTESIILFRMVLSFIASPERIGNFAFWMKMLHENIFTQLYPFAYDENNSFSMFLFRSSSMLRMA
jgi:hypothetical protein